MGLPQFTLSGRMARMYESTAFVQEKDGLLDILSFLDYYDRIHWAQDRFVGWMYLLSRWHKHIAQRCHTHWANFSLDSCKPRSYLWVWESIRFPFSSR